MSSEYDPVFTRSNADGEASAAADLRAVRRSFAEAARPFLSSPVVWLCWAVLLPGAAIVTPRALAGFGLAGGLFLWSSVILLGGLVELTAMRRRGAFGSRSPLAAWALRVQGNLSLIGLALSAILIWTGRATLLPGLWLLLLGHSFFTLGGLAFPPMRTAGVLFQLGGAAALWPGLPPLRTFALATAAGCLWMARAVHRARSR